MIVRGLNILSEKLLLDVKMEKYTPELRRKLEELEPQILQESLASDDEKKAFWINIYNAYYQILRVVAKVNKPEIYKKKLFVIAGNKLSLDDVEHGILRKYRYKYSLGFLPSLWVSSFVRQNAVDKLDYRIHFALNCGAKSCPPIAFYNAEKIDAQLDMASQSFLESESDIDDELKIVSTTALFKWFYADFGGKSGIRRVFAEQLKRDISNYRIKYKAYSWEDDLANFR